MDNVNTTELTNSTALGMLLGELKAKVAAQQETSAIGAAATADRFAKAEARLDELEAWRADARRALMVLASNAGKRFVWRENETGEETLTLEDAPDAGDNPAGNGGASNGPAAGKGQVKTVKPGEANSQTKPGRTGAFDAYRKVKPAAKRTLI